MADVLRHLIEELVRLPNETEWVEFKVNNTNLEDVGKNASAIANAAALCGRPEGFIVWGVDDATHELIGTTFEPREARKGNQPLEIYLATLLAPAMHITFDVCEISDKRIVVMRIPAAMTTPVAFKDKEYIRIGEVTSELRRHRERERLLWATFDQTPFELAAAMTRLGPADVDQLLNTVRYFDLLGTRAPSDPADLIGILEHDRLIRRDSDGLTVTNLGAVLLAKSLSNFPHLDRKRVRVVVYATEDRQSISRQQIGERGYALGFEGLVRWINSQLPRNEPIGQALRVVTPMYPEIAIREIVANALIHQDLAVGGAGPLIEIFPGRVEVTNPGAPLMPIDRIIDYPPSSRNDRLGALMRRMGMCEEVGSGVDRAVSAIEAFQLPAPRFEAVGTNFRVTFFSPRPFSKMDREDRLRACYQHAVLRYLIGDRMTNASLRNRLGVAEHNYAQVSRVIRDAVEDRLIRIDPPGSRARKYARYVPFWA